MSVLTHWYKCFQLLSFLEGVLLLFIYFPGIRKTSCPCISGFQKWISSSIFPKKDYHSRLQRNRYLCKEDGPNCKEECQNLEDGEGWKNHCTLVRPWMTAYSPTMGRGVLEQQIKYHVSMFPCSNNNSCF